MTTNQNLLKLCKNEQGCRFCEKKLSDRWYFIDTCRSCRRKQLRDLHKDSVSVARKIALKEHPKCWDCGSADSIRWYKDHTQCQKCLNSIYKKENKESISKKRREYDKNNKEKINETKRAYRRKTGRHRFSQSKRKAQKLKAMPAWVDVSEIKLMYKQCPDGMTVDHILPLQSDNICGLHVHWNLQYLSLSENSKKHNKFNFTYENDNWRAK